MAEKMIYQYLRRKSDNTRKGILVAVANDKNWALGLSMTNTKAGDKFNAGLGMNIAHGRAVSALEKQENHMAIRTELMKKVQELGWGVERGEEKEVTAVVPAVELSVEVPIGVWQEVEEFQIRAQRYFKDKQPACTYTANNPSFQKSVEQLQLLFEDELTKTARLSTPPSLREEAVTMTKIAEALSHIGTKAAEQKTSTMQKPVTRVEKP